MMYTVRKAINIKEKVTERLNEVSKTWRICILFHASDWGRKKRRQCLIFQGWIYDFTPLLPLCWVPISYYAYNFASESTAFISILGIRTSTEDLIPSLTQHQLRNRSQNSPGQQYLYTCHEDFYKKHCDYLLLLRNRSLVLSAEKWMLMPAFIGE